MTIVEAPKVTYTQISINGQNIALSSNVKASFSAPYNKIDITFKSTNVSLNTFKVAVTKASDQDYSADIGEQQVLATNVGINVSKSVSFNINANLFKFGDIKYRILLCAQSAVDLSWDLTELFMTFDRQAFIPANESEGLQVQVVTES